MSAHRLLAREFGPTANQKRAERLTKLSHAIDGELDRIHQWPTAAQRLATELQGTNQIRQELYQGAASELSRRPQRLDAVMPNIQTWEQNMADDLDLGLRMFGTSLHPLGEISDREHRTDTRDNRDELTLWQRLRRRLRL